MGQGAVKAYVQGFFSDPSGAQGIADRSGKQAAGEIVRGGSGRVFFSH
jgi:hypothetical protein